MPMTEDEFETVYAEVKGYFPAVSARLTRAPKLFALWRRTLRPFSTPLVLDAIARAASKNSRCLELDALLASIQHVMAERQQTHTRQSTGAPAQPIAATLCARLRQAARSAPTPEDRLIAKLHCQTVYRGLNRQHPDSQQKAAAQWRQWAAAYPAIQAYCLEQAEACCQLAAEPRNHTLQPA